MVVMKEHLRKMDDIVKMELSGMTPLAVRCSLKDLVPADLVTSTSYLRLAKAALTQTDLNIVCMSMS